MYKFFNVYRTWHHAHSFAYISMISHCNYRFLDSRISDMSPTIFFAWRFGGISGCKPHASVAGAAMFGVSFWSGNGVN